MIIKEVLDKTIQFFKTKNIETARLDAELIIARALNIRRIDLYLKFDQPMKDDEVIRCREVVKRRSQGEPVAYILGEKDFYGYTFDVDARVLVPRPETELLAEAAIAFLKDKKCEPVEVLDLGCGSGCLGLSIAKKIENAKVTLVDVSEKALEVTKQNAEKLEVLDRTTFVNADASQVKLDQQFDVVVANPPYIAPNDPRVQSSVAAFEPHLALFSGQDGFEAIESWSRQAVPQLKAGGWMGFEIGCDQGERTQNLFQDLGLQDVRIIQDLSGLSRHVIGRKGSTNG